ncbi:MAG TPA: hypothetical protein DDZ51_26045, partial [Planctomycetaceae bacterium]|nr:hypothetical protein [Planctomycetaceae bacterium]
METAVSGGWSMVFRLMCAVLMLPVLAASGQQVSINDLRQAGFAALADRDAKGAIAAADSMVKNDETEPSVWRLAGDLYLRAGDYKKAIVQFKRYIERHPEHEADLWQHGIALAFDGQY